MTVSGKPTARAERVQATRETILATAERLFAEHGIYAVSNRQVSEAAGQGNNAAVGYHFGTKTDLVRAIVRKHNEQIEGRRRQLVAEVRGSNDLRDWVSCLVRASTDHLAALGNPTWYGRFSAQLGTDPVLRPVVTDEARASPALAEAVEGIHRCVAHLPAEVRAERSDMTRQLMLHVIAERERALAEGHRTPRASWHDAATGLIDAIVGVWQAPVTPSA